ncbi:unnamed protein product [Mytilus edulis]|uniref:Uncharacterized protein n=1 Tax=Mytilus edulis TaxID=6550 RepID=A0A8S3VDH1_MYTED|nr:unnamed protein product [Mytilus edulis]
MVLLTPSNAFGCSSSNSGQQLTSNDSFLQNGAAGRPQAFGCSSSNSGQQLTSNDSFLQNGAADALKRLTVANGAADALRRLAVAVLIVDNNNSVFTEWCCRRPQMSSSNSLQKGAADASNNGAADASNEWCCSPQTFDCSSSNSGQQLTSNDRQFLQNGAADALKRLTVAVLIVDNNSPLMTVFTE